MDFYCHLSLTFNWKQWNYHFHFEYTEYTGIKEPVENQLHDNVRIGVVDVFVTYTPTLIRALLIVVLNWMCERRAWIHYETVENSKLNTVQSTKIYYFGTLPQGCDKFSHY